MLETRTSLNIDMDSKTPEGVSPADIVPKDQVTLQMLHTFEKCLLLLQRPRKQLSVPRLSLSGVGGGFAQSYQSTVFGFWECL